MNVNALIEMLRENMSYILPTSFSNSTARILVTVGEKEKGIMRKSANAMATQNENCELFSAENRTWISRCRTRTIQSGC